MTSSSARSQAGSLVGVIAPAPSRPAGPSPRHCGWCLQPQLLQQPGPRESSTKNRPRRQRKLSHPQRCQLRQPSRQPSIPAWPLSIRPPFASCTPRSAACLLKCWRGSARPFASASRCRPRPPRSLIASASGDTTSGSRRFWCSTTSTRRIQPLHSNRLDPTRLPTTAPGACFLWRPLPCPPAMRHSLGRVVATAAVAASVPQEVIVGLLDRHAARDWGDLDAKTGPPSTPITATQKAGSCPATTPRSTAPSG